MACSLGSGVRVESHWYVFRSMVSLRNDTCPSPKAKVAPLGCRLANAQLAHAVQPLVPVLSSGAPAPLIPGSVLSGLAVVRSKLQRLPFDQMFEDRARWPSIVSPMKNVLLSP